MDERAEGRGVGLQLREGGEGLRGVARGQREPLLVAAHVGAEHGEGGGLGDDVEGGGVGKDFVPF